MNELHTTNDVSGNLEACMRLIKNLKRDTRLNVFVQKFHSIEDLTLRISGTVVP